MYCGDESLDASCWLPTRCLLIDQQLRSNHKTVHLKTGFISKFSWEDFYEWGMQAKAHCERNLNCQLWRKVGGRCFIENLYQALFLFCLACWNVIYRFHVSGPITWGLVSEWVGGGGGGVGGFSISLHIYFVSFESDYFTGVPINCLQ